MKESPLAVPELHKYVCVCMYVCVDVVYDRTETLKELAWITTTCSMMPLGADETMTRFVVRPCTQVRWGTEEILCFKIRPHHLLGNVQGATTYAKETRDKGNVAASDLCALCNLRETRGHCWPKTISLESSETESTVSM